MLPAALVGPLLKLEERLLPLLGRLMAFRLLGVIEAKEQTDDVYYPGPRPGRDASQSGRSARLSLAK